MSTRKTTVKANPALSSIKSSGIAEQQKQVALPEPANPNADASDGGWTLLKGKRTKANAPVSSVSNSTRRSSQRNGRSQTKKTNVQTGGGNEKSPFTDDEVLAVFGADDVLGPPRLAIKLYKSRVYPGTIFSPLNKQLTSLVDGGKLVSLPELGRFKLAPAPSMPSKVAATPVLSRPTTQATVSAGDVAPRRSTANAGGATTNMGGSTAKGGGATTNMGGSTAKGGGATANVGGSAAKAGVATANVGESTANVGESTVNAGGATANVGGSTVNAGAATAKAGVATAKAGVATASAGVKGGGSTAKAGTSTVDGGGSTAKGGATSANAGGATASAVTVARAHREQKELLAREIAPKSGMAVTVSSDRPSALVPNSAGADSKTGTATATIPKPSWRDLVATQSSSSETAATSDTSPIEKRKTNDFKPWQQQRKTVWADVSEDANVTGSIHNSKSGVPEQDHRDRKHFAPVTENKTSAAQARAPSGSIESHVGIQMTTPNANPTAEQRFMHDTPPHVGFGVTHDGSSQGNASDAHDGDNGNGSEELNDGDEENSFLQQQNEFINYDFSFPGAGGHGTGPKAPYENARHHPFNGAQRLSANAPMFRPPSSSGSGVPSSTSADVITGNRILDMLKSTAYPTLIVIDGLTALSARAVAPPGRLRMVFAYEKDHSTDPSTDEMRCLVPDSERTAIVQMAHVLGEMGGLLKHMSIFIWSDDPLAMSLRTTIGAKTPVFLMTGHTQFMFPPPLVPFSQSGRSMQQPFFVSPPQTQPYPNPMHVPFQPSQPQSYAQLLPPTSNTSAWDQLKASFEQLKPHPDAQRSASQPQSAAVTSLVSSQQTDRDPLHISSGPPRPSASKVQSEKQTSSPASESSQQKPRSQLQPQSSPQKQPSQLQPQSSPQKQPSQLPPQSSPQKLPSQSSPPKPPSENARNQPSPRVPRNQSPYNAVARSGASANASWRANPITVGGQ